MDEIKRRVKGKGVEGIITFIANEGDRSLNFKLDKTVITSLDTLTLGWTIS